MYAAGGGDGYLTMAETALDAVQSAGLLDRFADVFSISNKKNKEIAFALHLENGEYTSGSYFSYFIWGSTQIKAEYRNAPDGVPVSSNQWFLYSDDFIGFLKRSKELGDPADRCDLHGAHGRQRYVRSHPVAQQAHRQYLYGHDGLGAGFHPLPLCAVLHHAGRTALPPEGLFGSAHGPQYAGAARLRQSEFLYRLLGRGRPQALVDENLKEFAEEGNVYFTLIRLGAIHDYNPYRYVDGLGQCGIDTSRPNQLLMPVSKKAMNKNNKITQTQGWS